jgi:coenzyme F420-0:L-glutamate ligase / coenzyme F420-1:gamma-L-glutamate ligase
MELIPIRTPLIHAGDDLAVIFAAHTSVKDGDIIIVSSKVIATAEGAAVDLSTLTISEEAERWSTKTGRSAAFMQAVLDEKKRMRGAVVGSSTGALLTELRPDGLQKGTLLVPNAGMDESNIENGYAIGWPINPVKSARELHAKLLIGIKSRVVSHELRLAVLITDSCIHLRRHGVTAFALATCGINPLRSEIGKRDLFHKEMHITIEATADQLATAGNMLMGNTAQSTPAVIIRNHGLPFSNFCGWVDGIEAEDDLFSGIL